MSSMLLPLTIPMGKQALLTPKQDGLNNLSANELLYWLSICGK